MADNYRCEACGRVFEKGWSDEEAEAEYQQDFAAEIARGEPRSIVCDDCYRRMFGLPATPEK